MKQPFWILNSILIFILLIIAWFIFFSKIKLPVRSTIIAEITSSKTKKSEIDKLDVSIIYKNDIFGTYQPEIKETEKEEFSSIPKPPEPIIPYVPEISEPQFLEPLPLTLTGIIAQTDETKNRAIIMDNKTNKQTNHKVGDEIEDAQLIRIFKNKIILVRSNGQQEILYLRIEDAKSEQNKTIYKNIVEKISENYYLIDPINFISYVNNLNDFIELLNLSSAYKQGEGIIGSRIGKVESNSLAYDLGLMPADVILKINNISTDTTDNTFKIYKNITKLKENDSINVEILRNNNLINITYKIKPCNQKNVVNLNEKKIEVTGKQELYQEKKMEEEKMKILKEKHKFAPTLNEIKQREKQNILKRQNLLRTNERKLEIE